MKNQLATTSATGASWVVMQEPGGALCVLRRLVSFGTCALTLTAAHPCVSTAQSAAWEMVGIVRNLDGTGIPGATVEVGAASARTDATGFFRLQATRRDTLTIAVKRIGFRPVSSLLRASDLTGDTLLVVMNAVAQTLDAVAITARDRRSALGLGSFEERRSRGLGVFVARDEIAKRNTLRLSDVVRNRRGVQLVRLAGGSYGVRFVTAPGRPGRARCIPALWLDGTRARDMEIDEVPANTVEAMELYQSLSTTPFQFSSGGSTSEWCGAIVIWTRVPGTP